MRNRIADEHIPDDTSLFWRDLAETSGGAGKLHRSFYLNTPHRLRIRLMLTLCEVTARESCVEPGCGAGYVTQGLARVFDRVDAFDSCEAMIAEAPQIEGVTYSVANADRWLPTKRYDVAFLSEVLEHVHNPRALVERCAGAADYVIASAPIDDPLAQERAFSVEARKHAGRDTRSDGAGHIWSWDWLGFTSLFEGWPVMAQAMVAQNGVVLVQTHV